MTSEGREAMRRVGREAAGDGVHEGIMEED